MILDYRRVLRLFISIGRLRNVNTAVPTSCGVVDEVRSNLVGRRHIIILRLLINLRYSNSRGASVVVFFIRILVGCSHVGIGHKL